MTSISLEGTNELMRHRDVAVILATGGMGLVRAAYSAGKPAYGVGPGNAPCYIERSADVAKAASDILIGKSFDHGAVLVAKFGRRGRCDDRRRDQAAIPGAGRILPDGRGGGRAGQGARDASAAPESQVCRTVGIEHCQRAGVLSSCGHTRADR